MASPTRTTTFADGNVLTAAQLNGEFNNLLNALALVNSDISAGAAIAASKISGTAGVLNGTQSWTGKNTFTATVATITTDTDGATITFDMTASNIHTVTLGGNRTLAVTNVASGQAFVIILKQGSGGQTVTWFANIKWPNATTPTLTTTASRYDVFGFIYDGTNYYGSIIGQNLG
ncbi:MAG: hypothetical protein C5B43_03470 [Verrucomicrobia bacterium]|nr:MAG: hypothetical protein C5B43_03470 [Verrucomicrobiota bacterium]